MNVEIINVGTELLLGEIVNTNATELQQLCKEYGFNVYYQSVVGDNPKRLLGCLETAFNRGADIVMTTGGLGPTQDDLTKELSAEFLGLLMVYDEDEAEKVKRKCEFCTGSSLISQNNYKQAFFPECSIVLENDMGTANGCIMKKDHKMIINLPGPPKEMKYVIEHSLKPYLETLRQEKIWTSDLIFMLIGESKADEMITDIIDRQDLVSIAMYASEEYVRVRLAVKAESKEDADNMMFTTKEDIKERLGEYLIDVSLEQAITSLISSIYIENKTDLELNFDFLSHCENKDSSLQMTITSTKEEMGEIVHPVLL